jgi:hypothetical protein
MLYSFVEVDFIAMNVLLDHVVGLHHRFVDLLNGEEDTCLM